MRIVRDRKNWSNGWEPVLVYPNGEPLYHTYIFPDTPLSPFVCETENGKIGPVVVVREILSMKITHFSEKVVDERRRATGNTNF